MLALFGLSPTEILAIAGLISAAGGFISTIGAVRRARSDEQEHCEDKLRAVRTEVMGLSDQLYAIKRKHPGE